MEQGTEIRHTLSVVIPSYNGKALLEKYLPITIAVCEKSRSVGDYEIIVADDASTDGTAAFLASHFPTVNTVTAEENGGFARNVNRGLHVAKYEWVLLLNNDMQLLDDTLDLMFGLCQPNIFGVSCAICQPDDGSVQEGQKYITVGSHRIHYSDNLTATRPGNTMYLCGGLALIDKAKLDSLGGFDEVYSPFYFEDTDLSLRAWQRGWRCLYTPLARGLHQHSATINSTHTPEHINAIFKRNQLLFNYRFLPKEQLGRFKRNIFFHSLQESLGRRSYRPFSKAREIIRAGHMKRQPLTEMTIALISNETT